MEITVKINIFDDPEYCSNREKYCQELNIVVSKYSSIFITLPTSTAESLA